MTDIAPTAPETGAVPLSTSIDPSPVGATQNGGGEVRTPEKSDKPESVQDSIRSVIKDADAKEAETKEKAEKAAADAKVDADKAGEQEKAAKPEGDKGKPAKGAKAENNTDPAKVDAGADKGAADKPAAGQEGAGQRQSEGRQHSEPPARFLPDARDKWGPTPREVKSEIYRVTQEYEQEISKHKASAERYEPIRQFDEIARANGQELKDSLEKVVRIEQQLARNPIAGLEMIMREIGPRKADGSPLTLYEVAHAIAKQSPQQYQATMAQFGGQQQPQRQQANPEVAALKGELGELKSMLMTQQVSPIIETFAAQHPDYHALEDRIAEVLKSKVIDNLYGTGLSPEQKLAEAYRMVGGRMATSHSDPAASPAHSQPAPAPQVDPDGRKSVTGAPNGGEDASDDSDADVDIRSLLKKGLRKTV